MPIVDSLEKANCGTPILDFPIDPFFFSDWHHRQLYPIIPHSTPYAGFARRIQAIADNIRRIRPVSDGFHFAIDPVKTTFVIIFLKFLLVYRKS